MQRVHNIVDGLVNETTRTQAKNAISKIEGVKTVCVDLGRSSIEVIYNEPASAQEINACIESTGLHIK